ncbi:MAG: GntR family transcriptional regulator [Sphingomonas bacterium]|jgi:GntR family transcriptional regulator|uniref:GntR family transcriptional regulator n=1 Tax=Sphingomonas bacterium TaxID=1895847 RepID=UPI00260F1262|nr:GntR family transcriptional regulator [Sphingomonas bacterium]MDB5703830.1 GntR family transcriptional regulator [Sphingomonas bacterium]
MRDDSNEALEREDVRSERGIGYRKITEALIGDIKAGRWTVAGQLPTEAELVERFGASRNTIRESLRELEVFGYIKRRRGTRSILLSTDPSDSFVNSVQSIGELLQYSRRTESRVISVEMVVATGALAERLGVKPDSQWLRVEILRMPIRGALPLGFSEIYVDGRYAGLADKMRAGGTVYRVLEDEIGVTFRRVEQVVEAAAATTPIAEYLKVPAGSPLLVVRTEFVTSAGEIAEIGFGHFPAGRYRMEIILERGPGGRAEG